MDLLVQSHLQDLNTNLSSQKILYTFTFACLLQFGVSAQKKETIEFRSFYDSLSFALGAEHSVNLDKTNANFNLLDKNDLIRGFQENLFGDPVDESCEKTMKSFLGRKGDEFNIGYVKAGSRCIGSYLSSTLYTQMNDLRYLQDLNMYLVLQGFKQGAYKQQDKFLSWELREALIAKFGEIVEADFLAEIERKDKAFWSEVHETPNLEQVGETGIYFETIEEGTGGSPTEESDIEAHYILTNALGDTLESSFENRSSLKINLTQVIPGWREGFPALQKGGKYRLFVPYEKAYKGGRKEAPQGALCFYIEFIDFGPQGSIARPAPAIKRRKH